MSRDSNGEVNIAASKPTDQPTNQREPPSCSDLKGLSVRPSVRPSSVRVVLPAATVAGLSFASSSNTAAADNGENDDEGRGRGR